MGSNEIDSTEVERNNPSGDAKEYDSNPVIYFNALTALPDLDDFIEGDYDDDALFPASGLLANGNDAVALTTVGHLADGVKAPPALADPLGPPANLSNSSGNNNALGAGPGSINRTPVGNGATGNNGALGSPANKSAAKPALTTAPTNFLGSDAPLALTTALSPLADENGLLEGHNAIKASAATLMPPLTTVPQVTVSLALRPMGVLNHWHPPLVRTVWSPGAMPLRSFLWTSACRPTDMVCWRSAMPRMQVPAASAMPLRSNQPLYIPFSIVGMRKWGGNWLQRSGGQGRLHWQALLRQLWLRCQ